MRINPINLDSKSCAVPSAPRSSSSRNVNKSKHAVSATSGFAVKPALPQHGNQSRVESVTEVSGPQVLRFMSRRSLATPDSLLENTFEALHVQAIPFMATDRGLCTATRLRRRRCHAKKHPDIQHCGATQRYAFEALANCWGPTISRHCVVRIENHFQSKHLVDITSTAERNLVGRIKN